MCCTSKLNSPYIMNKLASLIVVLLSALFTFSCHLASDGFDRTAFVEHIVNLEASEDIRMLAPEIQASLWRFKLTDDIKTGTLTKEERKIFKSLRSMISPDCMKADSQAQKDLRAETERVSARLAEMGWSEEKMFAYLETVLTLDELKRLVANKKAKGFSANLNLDFL